MYLRHILVPTDFSAGSNEALATAIGLALDTGARITVFHVHHVPAQIFPDMIMPIGPELMHDIERSAAGLLEELCARARVAGVEADWQTSIGSTHVEICHRAHKIGADLIVIGTHGRTGLSHVLLGSVAEKVVRRSPCPVLTVRPEMHSTFAHA
jgi:nucleotide-binding universal stress UspA family protein